MKRVLVWHWGRRGAGPVYTLGLANALSRHGFDIALSVSRQAEIYDDYCQGDFRLHAIDTYRNMTSGFISLFRIPQVRRDFMQAIRSFGADVVLATMPHIWDPWCVDAVTRTGAKLVTIVHDAVSHPGDSFPFRRQMIARGLAYSSRVVTMTKHVAVQLGKLYSYPTKNIEVIPHSALFADTYIPQIRNAPFTPFRFLFFGRLLPYKGLDLIVDAADILAQRRIDFELSIVGSGPCQIPKDRLVNNPSVRFINRWVPEDQVTALLGSADAVVLPYKEASQSGVVAAAMGVGIPVIATPVGGLPEQIIPHRIGLISESVCAQSIADCMATLVLDPALYTTLSRNAVKAAQGPLSWETTAHRFSTLLATL